MKTGAELITQERRRQIEVEGWSAGHDEQHARMQLTKAAICYIFVANEILKLPHAAKAIESARLQVPDLIQTLWPWAEHWWKPTADPVRNLVKAGALIAAEIDRLQRLPPAS
jgi:hypothetical protein